MQTTANLLQRAILKASLKQVHTTKHTYTHPNTYRTHIILDVRPLPNIGNTCYLNAALQTLLSMLFLQVAFLDPNSPVLLIAAIFRFRYAYFHSCDDELRKYYAELRKLLSDANPAWFQMLSPASAAECLSYILDEVMKANSSLAPFIKHWRQVTLGDCITPNCKGTPPKPPDLCQGVEINWTNEPFNVALAKAMCCEEKLAPDGLGKCGGCQKKSCTTKTMKTLQAPPNVLLVDISRRVGRGGAMVNIEHREIQPDMKCTPPFPLATEDSHSLTSLIVHENGHLINFVREKNGNWTCCDDGIITRVNEWDWRKARKKTIQMTFQTKAMIEWEENTEKRKECQAAFKAFVFELEKKEAQDAIDAVNNAQKKEYQAGLEDSKRAEQNPINVSQNQVEALRSALDESKLITAQDVAARKQGEAALRSALDETKIAQQNSEALRSALDESKLITAQDVAARKQSEAALRSALDETKLAQQNRDAQDVVEQKELEAVISSSLLANRDAQDVPEQKELEAVISSSLLVQKAIDEAELEKNQAKLEEVQAALQALVQDVAAQKQSVAAMQFALRSALDETKLAQQNSDAQDVVEQKELEAVISSSLLAQKAIDEAELEKNQAELDEVQAALQASVQIQQAQLQANQITASISDEDAILLQAMELSRVSLQEQAESSLLFAAIQAAAQAKHVETAKDSSACSNYDILLSQMRAMHTATNTLSENNRALKKVPDNSYTYRNLRTTCKHVYKQPLHITKFSKLKTKNNTSGVAKKNETTEIVE